MYICIYTYMRIYICVCIYVNQLEAEDCRRQWKRQAPALLCRCVSSLLHSLPPLTSSYPTLALFYSRSLFLSLSFWSLSLSHAHTSAPPIYTQHVHTSISPVRTHTHVVPLRRQQFFQGIMTYIYTHTHTHKCMHIFMHACMITYVHTDIHTCIYTIDTEHGHIFGRVTCTHAKTQRCTYMHAHTHTNKETCMHTCILTYTHTRRRHRARRCLCGA